MIAKTILEQIGGRRFAAMTGSKDFIDMGNGLRMSLARNKTSANRLDIIYDADLDLYNMRFYCICVVFMLLCPNMELTVSIGTPLERNTVVAAVWRL